VQCSWVGSALACCKAGPGIKSRHPKEVFLQTERQRWRPEAGSKEKYGVWDPMPELTITSPYVHFTESHPTHLLMDIGATLCQSHFIPQSGTLDLASGVSANETNNWMCCRGLPMYSIFISFVILLWRKFIWEEISGCDVNKSGNCLSFLRAKGVVVPPSFDY
jgi:hypothetical protein